MSDFIKTIEDTSHDTTRITIEFGEVRMHCRESGYDITDMYFTPKQARKVAKALKKAAKLVDAE